MKAKEPKGRTSKRRRGRVLLDDSRIKGQFQWVCLLTFGSSGVFLKNRALVFLAWSIQYVIIFFVMLLIFSDFGNSPGMHICSFSDPVCDGINSTSFRRSLILGHSHRQWNSKSFSTLHFTLTIMKFGSVINSLQAF